MTGPTRRQTALLEFMAAYQTREGMPPTLTEMRRFLNVRSPTAPLDMLKALDRKGYVTRQPRISRGSRLTEKGRAYLSRQLSFEFERSVG